MKLRELLQRVGCLSKATSNFVLNVVPTDRRKNFCFEVDWVNDYEGTGPEYQFFSYDDEFESEYFYHIPLENEGNPPQLSNVGTDWINWDSEEWMVDRDSMIIIKEFMTNLQNDWNAIKEAQK